MKHSFYLLLLTLTLILGGCQSGINSATSETAEAADPKTFTYNLLRSEYLWAEHTAENADLDTYEDAATVLELLKYQPLDRYSFIISQSEYFQRLEQSTYSDGLFGIIEEEGFRIYYVQSNSPGEQTGLRRGDLVYDIETIDAESYRYFVNRSGTLFNVVITLRAYTYNVADYTLLTHNEKKVGYLRYDEFTGESVNELDNAFNLFRSVKINELILDLRYNPGGSIAVASILMDKLAGARTKDALQFQMRWNSAYSHKNYNYYFEEDSNSLAMERVFIITTKNSASASELIINALNPYVDVITIGSTTYGKPVGMEGKVFGDDIYFLINFELLNAQNSGGYYTGIAPTCAAEDDLTHTLGNPEEASVATALYYIDNNRCKE